MQRKRKPNSSSRRKEAAQIIKATPDPPLHAQKLKKKTKTKIISTIISSGSGYEEERRLKTTNQNESRKPQAKTMFRPFFVEPAARLYDQDLSQMWTE
jgi:hypothetical protein